MAACATCNSRLLVDRIQVPDSAFEHSTAVNSQHGAAAARDDPTDLGLQERAWCPEMMVHTELREFMQIDLGRQTVIKMIITKGRVAQSKGRQTTPYFYIKYRRERASSWLEYRKENGTRRFNGNQDAMTENYNTMEPPFVARFVRIYPFSLEPTKTCLKLEILGCDAGGIVEYRIPQGTSLVSANLYPPYSMMPTSGTHQQTRFEDQTYDSPQPNTRYGDEQLQARHLGTGSAVEPVGSLILHGGLGKLTDNDTESNPSLSPFSSFKYVGWKRPVYAHTRTLRRHPNSRLQRVVRSTGITQYFVPLLFRFDAVYNFSAVHFYLSNDFQNGVSLPSNVSVRVSMEDPAEGTTPADSRPAYYAPVPDRSDARSRWITVVLPTGCTAPSSTGVGGANATTQPNCPSNHVGQFVEVDLYFMVEWIVLGEVVFVNQKANASLFSLAPRVVEPTRKFAKQTPTPNIQSPPALNSVLPFDPTLLHGTPTTLTLSIICGLLATLICIGLLCMVCLWRRKRGGARGITTWCHLRKPHMNGTSHVAERLTNHHTGCSKPNSNPTTSTTPLIGPRMVLDTQTPFQHPQHCTADRSQPSQPYMTSTHLYSNHHFPMTPQVSGASSSGVDHPSRPSVYRYPTNGAVMLETGNSGPNGKTLSRGAPEMMHFLPVATSQDPSSLGQLHPMFPCSFPSTNPYGKNGPPPDNAIYTSLPGSDCDSQPYARVANGPPSHQPGSGDEPGPGFDNCGTTAVQFVRSPFMPPPPAMPLPPIPASHWSPQFDHVTRRSPVSGGGGEELGDSGVSLVNSQSLPDHSPTNWTATPMVGLPGMNAARGTTMGMLAGDPMTFGAPTGANFYTLQGSDYSNVTLGSSTNGYGAYYGRSIAFPTGTAAYPIQIRR